MACTSSWVAEILSPTPKTNKDSSHINTVESEENRIYQKAVWPQDSILYMVLFSRKLASETRYYVGCSTSDACLLTES